MHVNTANTKSMEHSTFNGMQFNTVDTGFKLHFVS